MVTNLKGLNFCYETLEQNNSFITFSAIRTTGMLSDTLFLQTSGFKDIRNDLALLCNNLWTDLADSIADLENSIESYLILANLKKNEIHECYFYFLVIGRGSSAMESQEQCLKNSENLWILLNTTLSYAVFEKVNDKPELLKMMKPLNNSYFVEILRRRESIKLSENFMQLEKVIGFSETNKNYHNNCKECVSLKHLFPWIPSDNNWVRLIDSLMSEDSDTSLIIHFEGQKKASEKCIEQNINEMITAENIPFQKQNNSLVSQTKILLQEIIYRQSILEKSIILANVFVSSKKKPSEAFVSIVEGSLDDASIKKEFLDLKFLFYGGAKHIKTDREKVLSLIDKDKLEYTFSPKEATSIIRTPIPNNKDFLGFSVNRFRTAPIIGNSNTGTIIGNNVHQGRSSSIKLDNDIRNRHTYIIGQTGTGKSNLLSHMILNDIREKKGVAVLDPHGTLIENILLNFPKERAEDLLIIDVTDSERPIGFNILKIDENDPFKYKLARNLLVDDLYTFIDSIYNLKATGGPMFEMYFRNMLTLLLGDSKQSLAPNLLIFKKLFNNKKLRDNLLKKISTKDPKMSDFVSEIEATYGQSSLKNISPYITSKFSRFLSDTTLKNMICQDTMLNVDDIVNGNKILLFYLGKGKFGEQVSGLLASQLVSRIKKAVMGRKIDEQTKTFNLYADEFQIFADSSFSELLAEARKFKLSLTLAHQFAHQLPNNVIQSILGNVGTIISFRTGIIDSPILEPIFYPIFSKEDISSIPNYNAYVRSYGKLGELPFNIMTLPPENNNQYELASNLRELSRLKYGRDRVIVEHEIIETYNSFLNR